MAYPQNDFANVTVCQASLIGKRHQAVCHNTIRYQLDVLKRTGRYDAFTLQWHPAYDEPPLVWPIPNHLFWDSDVAKWIEGACYFLKQQALPEIDSAVRELVEMIRSAQQADGYLNIHYTVVEPGKRFTNLRDMHELYNAGHLIEAALAHHDCYRTDQLLAPVLRYVELLCSTFGPSPGQLRGYPGHPEIELALLRLYHHTNNPKHLALANFFLTERGNPNGVDGHNYFVWEAKHRGDDLAKRPAFYPEPQCLWYHQAHAPIAEQRSVEGHSVRAMYLLTAVADLCRVEQNKSLEAALYRLWDNMVQHKMYITGGIGAIEQWEGFGQDYYLPQGTDDGGCYSETCAAIGVMMLAQRLLQIDLNARYGDIMELCLYNAVLTAMSHDGERFTYVNQLASSNKNPSKREDWFTVACCPPNMLRLLGSIGGYIWSSQTDRSSGQTTLIANLYVPSTVRLLLNNGEEVAVSQQTEWPWDGKIAFTLTGGSTSIDMRLRIPGWADSYEVQPHCPEAYLDKGYLHLPSAWLAANKQFALSIPLKPRWIAPHPFTGQRTVSLARGPIVYCVEDFDNPWVDDHFKSVLINREAPLVEELVTDKTTGDSYVSLSLEGGGSKLDAENLLVNPAVDSQLLQRACETAQMIPKLHFVPYYFRANRGGKGHMRVGLNAY